MKAEWALWKEVRSMPGLVLPFSEKYTQAMHVIRVPSLLSAHLHSDLFFHFFPLLCFDQLWVVILEEIPSFVSVLPNGCYPKERKKGGKLTEIVDFSNCFWRLKNKKVSCRQLLLNYQWYERSRLEGPLPSSEPRCGRICKS